MSTDLKPSQSALERDNRQTLPELLASVKALGEMLHDDDYSIDLTKEY